MEISTVEPWCREAGRKKTHPMRLLCTGSRSGCSGLFVWLLAQTSFAFKWLTLKDASLSSEYFLNAYCAVRQAYVYFYMCGVAILVTTMRRYHCFLHFLGEITHTGTLVQGTPDVKCTAEVQNLAALLPNTRAHSSAADMGGSKSPKIAHGNYSARIFRIMFMCLSV